VTPADCPADLVEVPAWAVGEGALARAFDTNPAGGLTASAAAQRLAIDGPNELAAKPPTPHWRRAVRQFTDPLVLLLIVAIAISLAAWAVDGAGAVPLEAVVIAAIVVLNAIIGYWQESKAIRAVDALRRLTGTHMTVVRDGEPQSVLSVEVVRGDVVLLAEGDAVGADARLVEAASLRLDDHFLIGRDALIASVMRIDLDVRLLRPQTTEYRGFRGPCLCMPLGGRTAAR
jgi:Ca2+-transporting ATPase